MISKGTLLIVSGYAKVQQGRTFAIFSQNRLILRHLDAVAEGYRVAPTFFMPHIIGDKGDARERKLGEAILLIVERYGDGIDAVIGKGELVVDARIKPIAGWACIVAALDIRVH